MASILGYSYHIHCMLSLMDVLQALQGSSEFKTLVM